MKIHVIELSSTNTDRLVCNKYRVAYNDASSLTFLYFFLYFLSFLDFFYIFLHFFLHFYTFFYII